MLQHPSFLKLNDVITSFAVQTNKEDAELAANVGDYVIYESKKLKFLKSFLEDVKTELQSNPSEEVVELQIELEGVLDSCDELLVLLEDELSATEYLTSVEDLVMACKNLGKHYSSPSSKPYVVDITDGGPGVSISDHEVT